MFVSVKSKSITFYLALSLFLGACSAPSASSMDAGSSLGKAGLLDAAQTALSTQDCSTAISIIKPVYESTNTDNAIRTMMASAYACEANVNVFRNLGDIVTNISTLAGVGFWSFLSTTFPSTLSDRASEGAQLAQDALHSIISPSAVILPTGLYNASTYNPAAYKPGDRLNDANAYLMFVSLAGIGALENRYGSPYANGKRGGTFPWAAAADVNGTGTATQADGCAYASAIVNYVDALGTLSSLTSGSIATAFSTLNSAFQVAIYSACDHACTLGGVASCPTCPEKLRSRTGCTGVATDPATVAALGIIRSLTNPGDVTEAAIYSLIGWQLGP